MLLGIFAYRLNSIAIYGHGSKARFRRVIATASADRVWAAEGHLSSARGGLVRSCEDLNYHVHWIPHAFTWKEMDRSHKQKHVLKLESRATKTHATRGKSSCQMSQMWCCFFQELVNQKLLVTRCIATSNKDRLIPTPVEPLRSESRQSASLRVRPPPVVCGTQPKTRSNGSIQLGDLLTLAMI